MNVQSIREQFRAKLANKDFAEDGNLELVNAHFVADEPSIFGTVNEDWNEREVDWYFSMSRNVNDIMPPVPQIWQKVASKDGLINSNYGWCIFSSENGKQYVNCAESLEKNRESRQAVMIYTRPSMHVDSKENGMSDFICTNVVQTLIRNNTLQYFVYMRSNDAVFGFKGDFHWHTVVRDLLWDRLQMTYQGLQKGNIHWNACSLHVYPRHFHLVAP